MKGKTVCLMIFFIFALPLIAAKLVLEMNWYKQGVTNQGQWMPKITTWSWLPEQGRWRLVYMLPAQCDSQCKHALFQLNQIPKAIGREKERVASILLVKPNQPLQTQSLENQIQKSAALPSLNATFEQIAFIEHPISAELSLEDKAQLAEIKPVIYLVDPLDQVILTYALALDEKTQIKQSKGLMKDLKKLMKLSKMG